jgi:MEMO1 family protein
MKPISEVRPSPIAGTWYSSNRDALAQSIDRYLAQAVLPELDGQVLAVIAPHAGHRYSGSTAGYAFRAVSGQAFERVIVVAPMHQYHPDPLLTTAHAAYATPLGTIPVDTAAISALDACLRQDLGFGLTAVAADKEHSLEIELPFLQRALPAGFKLLPVMVRDQSPETAQALGKALAKVALSKGALGRGVLEAPEPVSTLLVASTDLSHFYTEPVADQLDAAMLAQVAAFSPEGIYTVEHEGRGQACGLGAIAAILWAARELGADQVKILHHTTSASTTGDRTSVVGYGAAVILKTPR